ncbi:MAG: glycoside hydrolase family 68 protein [Chloroflexota bacterium]
MKQRPSRWTPEMVRSILPDDSTTIPLVNWASRSTTLPGFHVWDTWPVQLADGRIALFGSWSVWIMLSAPDTVAPEERHNIAHLRVACRDREGGWHDQGPLFPSGDALGSRQWAGSTIYDPHDKRVTVFYTAAGRSGETAISYEQRIVAVRGRMDVSDRGVRFREWSDHHVILEADGVHYKSTRGTRGGPGAIDAFRDPGYLRDPATGDHHLLFTASIAESDTPDHDGAIGLAKAVDETLERWVLQPPVLTAAAVNKELERPHAIVRDGLYYLFFSTHGSTFAPGLSGPEGLYGFVGHSIEGPYTPLNGSGLVLQNPEQAPYQSYSWLVLADGQVISFLYYGDLGGKEPEDLSPEHQRDAFGGIQAPTLQLQFSGQEVRRIG